jgi:trimeric autotransporter adhesin
MCMSFGSNFTSSTNPELSAIYDFVIAARDTLVTGGSTVDGLPDFAATAFGANRTQTVTITNYRDEFLDFKPSISTNATDFSVVNSTCTLVSASPLELRVGAATAPGAPGSPMVPTSCSVTVGFQPAVGTTAARSGNLNIEFTAYSTAQPRTRDITLNGTAQFAVYSPSGFGALSGFVAASNASQTMCPTISNTSATTASLSIALSIAKAPDPSPNYSNYYELDTLAACAGGSPPLCVPAGSVVTGSTSLAAGSSCSLPIKFNPGKFGFAGGTGARAAKLTVTHNYPTAGQTNDYVLSGTVTTGPEPAIGITTNPSAVGGKVLPPAFAHQVVGTTSALWNDFLVSNSGSADGLDITQVTSSNATEFALSEDCVAAPPLARLVGSGPTCRIGLTFSPLPTSLGQRCTDVTIHAAFASNNDQVVTVCGTGVPVPVPQMSVTPGSIAFGNRSIGATYKTEPLVIGNAVGATADLLIGAVTLTGNGFAFVPDVSACQSKTVAAGASCALQLQFTPDPNTPGVSYSAAVTIDSNDPTTPHRSIALTATAVAYSVPVLQWQVASTTLNFPDLVVAGQQSAQPLIARLANVDGPGAVDVQAVRLVGADASNFSISSCPSVLYQGDTCDVSLRFLPGSGGFKSAQVQVVTATGVAPPLLTVQGQGVGGGSPYLILSTRTLDFGGVRVGARSDPLMLTLAAGGDGVLRVTSMAVAAPFNVQSGTCPPVPFTLPLGSDCSIQMTFAPTSASGMSTTLSIGTDASAQAVEVSVAGVGQDRADTSSGGCSMMSGESLADPTLWALVLLAAAGLVYRHRTREALRRAERHQRDHP